MSAAASIYGRLGGDPVERTSQSGKTWATASIAVTLGSGDQESTLWFGLVAFGRVAEQLCRHAKGDLVSASGQLKVNAWRGADGNEREQLQVVADALVSAKTVRPGGGKRRETGS